MSSMRSGLVEDEDADPVEADKASLREVLEAAGRRHENVRVRARFACAATGCRRRPRRPSARARRRCRRTRARPGSPVRASARGSAPPVSPHRARVARRSARRRRASSRTPSATSRGRRVPQARPGERATGSRTAIRSIELRACLRLQSSRRARGRTSSVVRLLWCSGSRLLTSNVPKEEREANLTGRPVAVRANTVAGALLASCDGLPGARLARGRATAAAPSRRHPSVRLLRLRSSLGVGLVVGADGARREPARRSSPRASRRCSV